MTVNKAIFRLAIKVAWYEVRGIDKVLLLLPYTPAPYSGAMYDSGRAILIGKNPHVEYHLVENVPQEALDRIKIYTEHIVVMHTHDSSVNAVFHGFSVLLPLGPITPRLQRLSLFPHDLAPAPFHAEAAFLLDLCCPNTLVAFSLTPPRNHGQLERMFSVSIHISPSALTQLLCELKFKRIRELNLERDYLFIPTTVQAVPQDVRSSLDRLTTISLFGNTLRLLPLELLATLPHLSHLQLSLLDHMVEPSSMNPNDRGFPSLECIRLFKPQCEPATRLLGIIPSQLRVILVQFDFTDDELPDEGHISAFINTLVQNRQTLHSLTLYLDNTPLSTQCVTALSSLNKLTTVAGILEFTDQECILDLFRRWPEIRCLNLPACTIDPEAMVELAIIWPHLTRLSIKLSMRQSPHTSPFINRSSITSTSNDGHVPDPESTLPQAFIPISTSSIKLTLRTELKLESDDCREIARLLVRCWRNVTLFRSRKSKLQNKILESIMNEIKIYRNVAD
ncbi:hypothetical protein RSAG8_09582, partial [Rhizoctonia solani AG-8 WAC10335]